MRGRKDAEKVNRFVYLSFSGLRGVEFPIDLNRDNMHNDFEKLAEHCQRHQRISKKVLDNFLMNYIGRKEGMDHKMNLYLQKYRHIIRKMPESFFPSAMGEYIMGKTMAPDGFIHKYMDKVELRSLDKPEREFLEFQASHPWRYCFAHIADHPAKNFFNLQDAFAGDDFLLYSPGTEAYWSGGRKNDLYFLLTGFNGFCHHTYGVIIPMQSFTPDDIYFYGTEVFPEVDSDVALLQSVYKDPIAYMMLASGMEFPITMSGENVLRHMVAVDEMEHFDTEKLKKHFSVQWNKNTYQISHETWSGHPHFAQAYYNEESGELTRYAMTEAGFRELTRGLVKSGLPIGPEADYSVGLGMVVTMQEILKKKIILNEYEALFPETDDDAMSEKELEPINRFMQLLLPCFNAKQQPDLQSLARQAGIEVETARSLYEQIKMKFGG